MGKLLRGKNVTSHVLSGKAASVSPNPFKPFPQGLKNKSWCKELSRRAVNCMGKHANSSAGTPATILVRLPKMGTDSCFAKGEQSLSHLFTLHSSLFTLHSSLFTCAKRIALPLTLHDGCFGPSGTPVPTNKNFAVARGRDFCQKTF